MNLFPSAYLKSWIEYSEGGHFAVKKGAEEETGTLPIQWVVFSIASFQLLRYENFMDFILFYFIQCSIDA